LGVKTADVFDKSGAGDCASLAAKEFAVGLGHVEDSLELVAEVVGGPV
jgi:hypothetical protein